MKIRFTKMQGRGMITVYVSNGSDGSIYRRKRSRNLSALPATVISGSAATGVIFINPSDEADFEMGDV